MQRPDRVKLDAGHGPLSLSRPLPDRIGSEEELDEILSRPRPELIHSIRTVSSPLLILGAGGKMGPTLALLARRAADAAGHPLEIIAVSRFQSGTTRQWLETRGVKTLNCDLLEADSLRQLPETQNLIHLVGLKFGTAQNPAVTWAVNALVPARVAERFAKARIVVLSTGNVYSLSPSNQGGSLETAPLRPLGEYANAVIGRERFFEFFSGRAATPVALLRLFYAVELRYGVLVDLARKVAQGHPIDLTTGHFNCIWQADANEIILRALPLAASPPTVWNVCRPETFSVRQVATRLGELLQRSPVFTGQEAPTALLGNASKLCAALGQPSVTLEPLLVWIAHWVRERARYLDKPTHFEVRNGEF
jgi:dTDP-4-dehydrorhamnose reductase